MFSSAIAHAPDHDTSWRTDGLCHDPSVDPDLFFDSSRSDEAKELCAACDVREQCLRFAMEENVKYGIFGGMDPKERRSLKRKRRSNAA